MYIDNMENNISRIRHFRRQNKYSLAEDSLNKSKQASNKNQQDHAVRREMTQTDDDITDQFDKLSTCNSPDPGKRFKSARKDRITVESVRQGDRHPTRIKSVVFRKEMRRNKEQPVNLDKMVKLSDMFSTAATNFSDLKNPVVSASSYCVMMTNSKMVLLGSKLDSRRQVASLTKLMTAITVLHLCKQYSVDMVTTMIVIDGNSATMEGTSACLKYGDEMSVMDLLHGMLLPSGNDAAVALANHFGKFASCMYSSLQENPTASRFDQMKQYYDSCYQRDSIRMFMFLMNRLSSQMGLKDTYFQNPTGLQHPKSHSTSYDMALLSVAFTEHPLLMAIVQKKVHHFTVFNHKLCTSRTSMWKNTNRLLWKKRDCKGLKTGNTPWAGPCLSTVFRVRSMEFVVVVLNSSTTDQRFSDAQKLYYWFKHRYTQA